MERSETHEKLIETIAEALTKSKDFSSVVREPRIGDMYFDIRADARPGIVPEVLVFEIKVRSLVDKNAVVQYSGYGKLLRLYLPKAKFILVVKGQLTEAAKLAARELELRNCNIITIAI